MGLLQHILDRSESNSTRSSGRAPVGRPGTGLHPLRGQNNVQGASCGNGGISQDAVFTYVLSHDASVELAIYTLSGRLVCRLGPQGQPAGFQQLSWDGRDRSGRLLANGTYLYRIVAVGGDSEVHYRGSLSVVR